MSGAYLRLALVCRGLDENAVDPFTAPRLRRVFGRALVERFCPYGAPRCDRQGSPGRVVCALDALCPYGILFASRARPPLALFVPEGAHRVEVTLFGPAWRLYPWVVRAFEQALTTGLGRGRDRFVLEDVLRVRRNGSAEPLGRQPPADLEPTHLEVGPVLREHGDAPVTVDLLSPARLVEDRTLQRGDDPPPLALLVGRILDRHTSLFEGRPACPRAEREALQARAMSVPILASDVRWIEHTDYSSRHDHEYQLGGKVGRVVYGEGAGRFLDILRVGEALHVGKNPASGCGRIAVRESPP